MGTTHQRSATPSRKPPGVASSPFELGAMIEREQRQSAGTGQAMQPAPAGKPVQGNGAGTALPAIGSKGKPAPLDPSAVVIIKARPVPPAIRGDVGAQSRAKQLLDRMAPGDSVDLAKRYAMSVAACAKKHQIRVAVRKLSEDTYGVWRLADAR